MYDKENYEKNKKMKILASKKYVAKKYRIIEGYKRTLRCKRCDFDFSEFPCVCDFHHLEPRKGKMTISRMIQNKSIKKVMEEIKKCMPLCANCHRIVEYKLKQGKIDKKIKEFFNVI